MSPPGVSEKEVTSRAPNPSRAPNILRDPSGMDTDTPSVPTERHVRPDESQNTTLPFRSLCGAGGITRRGRILTNPNPSVPIHSTPFDSDNLQRGDMSTTERRSTASERTARTALSTPLQVENLTPSKHTVPSVVSIKMHPSSVLERAVTLFPGRPSDTVQHRTSNTSDAASTDRFCAQTTAASTRSEANAQIFIEHPGLCKITNCARRLRLSARPRRSRRSRA